MTIEHPEIEEQTREIKTQLEKLLHRYHSSRDKRDEILITHLATSYWQLTGEKYVHRYVQEERKA